MSLYSDKEMEGREPLDQAKCAIAHMLNRIKDCPEIGYHCGLGTQSYGLLTEAASTLFGVPLEKIRRDFLPKHLEVADLEA